MTSNSSSGFFLYTMEHGKMCALAETLRKSGSLETRPYRFGVVSALRGQFEKGFKALSMT